MTWEEFFPLRERFLCNHALIEAIKGSLKGEKIATLYPALVNIFKGTEDILKKEGKKTIPHVYEYDIIMDLKSFCIGFRDVPHDKDIWEPYDNAGKKLKTVVQETVKNYPPLASKIDEIFTEVPKALVHTIEDKINANIWKCGRERKKIPPPVSKPPVTVPTDSQPPVTVPADSQPPVIVPKVAEPSVEDISCSKYKKKLMKKYDQLYAFTCFFIKLYRLGEVSLDNNIEFLNFNVENTSIRVRSEFGKAISCSIRIDDFNFNNSKFYRMRKGCKILPDSLMPTIGKFLLNSYTNPRA